MYYHMGLFANSPSGSTAGNSSSTVVGPVIEIVAERGLAGSGEVVMGEDDSNLEKDFVFCTDGLVGLDSDMSQVFAFCML